MTSDPGERRTVRLGVLLSGRGSNFQAIYQAIQSGQIPQAEIGVVISSRRSAEGLAFAESHGLHSRSVSAKAYPDRDAYDKVVLSHLQEAGVDLVILAGYMRLLTPVLLVPYENRILNIHPSLLPAYGGVGMTGLNVHEAVIAAGETESGCTVHLVTETVDGGPILGQARVPVAPGDTPQTLAARVLVQEHRLYPQVIASMIQTYCQSQAV